MPDDFVLLREYVDRGSEEAFRALVERHSGMVHGAALRILRDEGLAEEVTQAVFLILVRKAASLPRTTILAGWLYRAARFVAMEVLRREKRRQQRDQDYAQMNVSAASQPVWDRIAPLLDELMCRLKEMDRNVIILRFLEQKPFAEVGHELGLSEASAKMRLGRALDKLRSGFARRGVVLTTTALFSMLSAYSAAAAPPGVAVGVLAAALAQGAGMPPSTLLLAKGAVKAMTWTWLKPALIGASAVAAVLAGVLVSEPYVHKQPVFIASLEPMAGEWEGTYELRADRQPALTQKVLLSIHTEQGGHSCQVEMRVSNGAGRDTVYHFTHTLNDAGDRIITVDDPQIARLTGEGIIRERKVDAARGMWRVGFRTPNVNPGAYSDVRWEVLKGTELLIDRHDHIRLPQGTTELFSNLKLRRRSAANAQAQLSL